MVGQSAYTPEATRTAKGGGSFGGGDVVMTWRHAGTATNLPTDGLVVVVAKDLSLGTFSGHLADGTGIAGTFAC